MKPTLILDTEVYRNYFLASFLNAETGNVRHFEMHDGQALDIPTLRSVLSKYRLVTFNGNNFDLPMLAVALRGGSCEEIKRIADKIILNNMKHWQLDIDLPDVDHIDLIEVAPGIASLKIYGGRLHCPKMQDLPIEPNALITPDQRPLLREYCGNDLRTTLALFNKLSPQIKLRELMGEEYGIDLRSKSDAQIAEAVIKHEVEKSSGRRLERKDPFRLAGETFKYRPAEFLTQYAAMLPHYTKATGSQRGFLLALDSVCAATFTVSDKGVVQMPKEIANLKIKIGSSTYRMGIGGLHSSEESTSHYTDGDYVLIDRDVASYYPTIILNCDLKPAHMGEHFTRVYKKIVDERLAAKRLLSVLEKRIESLGIGQITAEIEQCKRELLAAQIETDCKKIQINGSFGKFGSPYSALYSPTLLIQTTVTGQLSLLMLIEMLESEGIHVVSANTDGIVIKCPRSKIGIMNFVVWEWEHATGFETEANEYAALYSRDVNNYIAIKPDGKYKLKGVYAPATLSKNPNNQVCVDAVVKYLVAGTPVETTIRECKDITRFVTIRTVKGGAVKGDAYLGKAIRWYYAQGETGTINYKVNGYTVPRSEGARPLMDLPDTFPADLDFDWYITEARSILNDIGYSHA